MWMEFTPKDWFMVRVGLIFRAGDPDPEDAWVRAYLHEHQLEPRTQAKEERQGIPCEGLYFGQCYLGRHLHALQDLYQKGLERSCLLETLRDLRQHADATLEAWPTMLDDPAFEALLPALAEALHAQVNFAANAEGYLSVSLDPTVVQYELSRLMTAAPPPLASDVSI